MPRATAPIRVLVLAIPVLLAGGASPVHAQSEPVVSQRMLVTPRSDALVTRAPARVAVRAPRGTSRLRVRVNGHDVSARFRGRGTLRVGRLARRDGLRYGRNHLYVKAERSGRAAMVEGRSFVLARRAPGIARLRLRSGPVTSLTVRMAGGTRLSAVRRERTVRVWLNDHRITRAVDRSRPTRWTASLSAAHGLRHGVNRLRMRVVEPEKGRYTVLRRRFVVRRDRHLAAAGWDVAAQVGQRVRLDGRHSRTSSGDRPRHRWRIISKPRGSRAVLRRARAPQPLLTPDRPGRYVVGLTVGDGTAAASADRVGITIIPPAPLVKFRGLTYKGLPEGVTRGIEVGDTFYAHPNRAPNSDTGSGIQWLTLDRATLEPTGKGNTWVDGSTASGEHGLDAFKAELEELGLDELVILSFPPTVDRYTGQQTPPVTPEHVDLFNEALDRIGAGPIDAKSLARGDRKLVVVGVPAGGDSSGWSASGGIMEQDALTGWLMPDATIEQRSGAARFRYQPARPAFDTSSSHTAQSNTMTIGPDKATGTLGEGVTGGFHVVELDPVDFRIVKSNEYGSNGTWDGLGPMVDRLRQIADTGTGYVAVQTIGNPTSSSGTWRFVATAMAAFGANPHTFNTAAGAYAFIGGKQLERSEVAQSSAAVVIDGTAQAGKLHGRARIRNDGVFMPVAAAATEALDFKMYDIVFRDPTPWPYTAGGQFPKQTGCDAPGSSADAYAAALSYIADGLGLSSYKANLRHAYTVLDESTWAGQKTDLLALPFEAGHGFGEAEFCNLKAQLEIEFRWLDSIKELFDAYEKALSRSGPQAQVDVQGIGESIREAIEPPDEELTSPALEILAGMFEIASHLGGPEIGPAISILASTYEIANSLASNAGAPIGNQIEKSVNELAHEVATNLTGTANALDRIRDVIISDWGRLHALGSVAKDPGWSIDVSGTTDALITNANAYFSSQLLPVAYYVWFLTWSASNHTPTTDNCYIFYIGHAFQGAPKTAQLWFRGEFDSTYGRETGGLWALGQRTLSTAKSAYAPAELTDQTFLPTTQKGYGVYLPDFMWSQYKTPPTRTTVCH